jgi:hypothetical protein
MRSCNSEPLEDGEKDRLKTMLVTLLTIAVGKEEYRAR